MTEAIVAPRPKPKSARRRAREFAVQGTYQWLMTRDTVNNIDLFIHNSTSYFNKCDEALYRGILFGVIKDAGALTKALEPHVERPLEEVSIVEMAILYTGAFEIISMPETPYPVIINESIELAKTFGGSDGHRFVNGVLDKLAALVRADEFAAAAAKRR
ncbi:MULTISPECIES: transcription antitermination factor NusB [Deefgea]|uniref:Transcription antitermination protein NusB n=1 Tax=Deefgea piscis TaxID=2739061 RepID=A0A6M8SQZ3_9NEIS|nr:MULTISPECIES: transcription antitermination factor NusB [Deefgea]MBM5575665.1 transcription antitermination factor NusB [Deefgea sp. CFH1-16]QKJ67625.1 transcription antitermination factor NusB [Deefgea piscis]